MSKLRFLVLGASLLIGGVAFAQPSPDRDTSAHKRGFDGNGGWHRQGRFGKDGKPDPARAAKRAQKRAAMLAKYDLDNNGKLDPNERAAMKSARAAEVFAKLDVNHDGVLSLDEVKPMLERRGMRGHHGKRGMHGKRGNGNAGGKRGPGKR